jgi:hypothetical protein
VLSLLGHFKEVARELPAHLEDAWRRNDLCSIPLWMSRPLLAWLSVGAEAEAEAELARAWHAWSGLENAYAHQDAALHAGRCYLLHYRGDHRAAWATCVEHDRRFVGSFARRSINLAATAQRLRGLAAAALAAETTSASERSGLLREAEHVPHALHAGSLWRNWLTLPLAAASCVRGDRERAIHLLRQVDAGPRPPWLGPIFVHAARRRLGVLVGGDDGRTLVANADNFFRAGGAVDPERLVATLLPACEIN